MPDSKDIKQDLAAIRALAEVLDDTGLTEIEIERSSVRLRVSKAPAQVAAAMPQQQIAAQPPAQITSDEQSSANDAGPEDWSNHPGVVTSPMVGTVYVAPSPGANAFITEGASVTEGQTVLIVEAMKTMNEIKAPRGGKVTKIFARDAEPIEFGEPLLIIE